MPADVGSLHPAPGFKSR